MGWGPGRAKGCVAERPETKQVGFSQNVFWVHLPQDPLGIFINNVEVLHLSRTQRIKVSERGTQDYVSNEHPPLLSK